MAEGDIWVTKFIDDSSFVKGTKFDPSEPARVAMREGREVSQEDLPLKIHARYKDEDFADLKEIVIGGGGVKVSTRIAEIFQSFNLGQMRLLPMRFFFYDRETPARDGYFILFQLEKRKFVIPEESKGIRPPVRIRQIKNPGPPTFWNYPPEPKDGDIAIVPRELNGLDFWVDPTVIGSVFMSDPLAQALKDAGYASLFKFRKCKVVRMH